MGQSLIAAGAGLFGALIGGLSTYFTTGRAAREQAKLAASERLQENRSETYVRALAYAVWISQFCQEQRTMFTFNPPRQLPDPPEDSDETLHRVMAFGSAEVVKRLRVLNNAVLAFQTALTVRDVAKTGPGAELTAAYKNLDEAAERVRQLAYEVRDQIRVELGVDQIPDDVESAAPILSTS